MNTRIQYFFETEATVNYIIQSNYVDSCSFWFFNTNESTIEDNRGDYDIGVWKIKYKSVN